MLFMDKGCSLKGNFSKHFHVFFFHEVKPIRATFNNTKSCNLPIQNTCRSNQVMAAVEAHPVIARKSPATSPKDAEPVPPPLPGQPVRRQRHVLEPQVVPHSPRSLNINLRPVQSSGVLIHGIALKLE